MSTQNRRVAVYLPPDLDSRFREYADRKGLTSDSQAIISLLTAVLGSEDKKPAIDRLEKLERRIEYLESVIAVPAAMLSNSITEEVQP